MKKLLLLLSLPLALFGCSKDRNFDGQITISDMGLAIQDYLIPFGEPIINSVNLFINSRFGAFLELSTIYPDRGILITVGWVGFLILILIEGAILYLIYLAYGSWVEGVKESWQKIKQEFQQENQVGRIKKNTIFIKKIIKIILSSALFLTIISFIIYAIICSLTSLEYNYWK